MHPEDKGPEPSQLPEKAVRARNLQEGIEKLTTCKPFLHGQFCVYKMNLVLESVSQIEVIALIQSIIID